jgi:23S rRNA A1618 N6-methylase RlmF
MYVVRRVVEMAQGQKSSQVLLWTFNDDHAKWGLERGWDFQ